jgi:hypothetical protein
MKLILPTMLAVLVTASGAGEHVAWAGDDCLGRPNAAAPDGEHWYYRIEPTTQRKCWYLLLKGTRGVRHSRTGWLVGMDVPSASAQQVPLLAPPGAETASIETPASTAEIVPETDVASPWRSTGNSVSQAADDIQQETRVHGVVAEQPELITADRVPTQPTERPATTVETVDRTLVREVLLTIALFLAVMGALLIGAARWVLCRVDKVASQHAHDLREPLAA